MLRGHQPLIIYFDLERPIEFRRQFLLLFTCRPVQFSSVQFSSVQPLTAAQSSVPWASWATRRAVSGTIVEAPGKEGRIGDLRKLRETFKVLRSVAILVYSNADSRLIEMRERRRATV